MKDRFPFDIPSPASLCAAHCPMHRRPRLLLGLLPLLLCACAKTGDPHPPVVLVPKPAVDLSANQHSDQVLLSVSMPVQNTNGSPVSTLGQIEVLRRVETDRAENNPLQESVFLDGSQVLFSIRAERVGDYLNDKTLLFRDELNLPDRPLIYHRGFRYAVRFVNRKNQSAGLSNQAFIAPVPVPPPPRSLSAEVAQRYTALKWTAPAENLDGSRPPAIAGYNVYRTEDPKKFPPSPLNSELLQKTEFEDRTFQFDKNYFYAVSVVASREKPYAESLASPSLAVSPRDKFPPGMPQNLNGVSTEGIVLLLWTAPADDDIAGYIIYRKEEVAADFQRLQAEPVSGLSFRDEKAPAGKKCQYRVSAVDTHGNEGPAAETAVEVY